MTISSATNKSGPYDCNGVTTDFTGEFRITDETHVQVIHADADGNETTLDLEAGDYSVSGVGDDQFTVTISPALADGTITLLLDVPFTQEIDLENQGAYQAEVVEQGFDLAVQRDKLLQEQLDRAVKVSASSSDDPATLADRLFAAADNAEAAATAAATSEGNAATSATSASGSATAASTSATNAATSETNAAASATTATTKAAAASTSATNAATSETNAAGSATAAAASQASAHTSEVNAAASAAAAAASASTVTPVADQINAATDADPTDDDFFTFRDTATGNLFKRSWANLKTLLAATAANLLANANSLFITVSGLWSALGEVVLTDAATIAVDMNAFINAKVTLGGNRTLGAPTNAKAGQTGRIRIVQDATGSRTLAYNSVWKFAGGTAPTLTTGATKEDWLYYEVLDATHIFASLNKDIR